VARSVKRADVVMEPQHNYFNAEELRVSINPTSPPRRSSGGPPYDKSFCFQGLRGFHPSIDPTDRRKSYHLLRTRSCGPEVVASRAFASRIMIASDFWPFGDFLV
jgi:hypothetical protein